MQLFPEVELAKVGLHSSETFHPHCFGWHLLNRLWAEILTVSGTNNTGADPRRGSHHIYHFYEMGDDPDLPRCVLVHVK